MKAVNRRGFLLRSSAAFAGAMASSTTVSRIAASSPQTNLFDRLLGFQSYGMRREIEKDFQGTLMACKELGYGGVEMCSPRGNHYKQAGFGNLTSIPASDIKKMIADTGLICKSAHFQAHEVLKDDPAITAEYAAEMGLEQVIMSGSGLSAEATADEIKTWGEKANKAAEVVQAIGLQLGYHNHLIGPMVDDKPQYEHIMDALDPDLVTMQFQFAAIRDGFDLVYYLEKYAGRYSSLHMHDFNPTAKGRQPGRIGTIVPIGEGMIDWAAHLKAAMKSKIAEHGFIVEIETETPLDGLERSISYLKKLKI